MIRQSITLRSRDHFGRRVPSQALAPVLGLIPEAVRQSVRMRFEGRSRGKGKRPEWLKAASDLRFLGHGGDDETVLAFESPTLGEAAPRLYAQQELWPTRPDADDSGFDLLADVLVDVADKKADSDLFDRPLLDSIAGFRRLLNGTFTEMTVGGRRSPAGGGAVVTPAVVAAARSLHTNTPMPQRVRIVGRLDMLRASTRSFAVILDDGQEVRGVLTEADVADITGLLNQRVFILGKAVYRPSGRLLRVDAGAVEATADKGSFFSAVPKPVRKAFDLRDTVRDQGQKLGVGAIIGRWPGDETDDQIAEVLRAMS